MKLTMTEELLRYNHYNLWNWLAKTGAGKFDAPMSKTLSRWQFNEAIVLSRSLSVSAAYHCFACGASAVANGKRDCRECPIRWGIITSQTRNNVPCLQEGSLFRYWEYSETSKSRKHYAALIAKLPWRGKKP